MDELTKYNIARWKALVDANALFTRPALSLDPVSARERLDPEGRLGDIAGKDVLCLACGGGQQSIAFALLNANVTVFDLSDAQLSRDREAAVHFGFDIKILQGDMQNLSQFEEAAFDIVLSQLFFGFCTKRPSSISAGRASLTHERSLPFHVRESILSGDAGTGLEW
jgi:SAM-dependent methyltransferase